jgi:small subunit ribosomal protein S18
MENETHNQDSPLPGPQAGEEDISEEAALASAPKETFEEVLAEKEAGEAEEQEAAKVAKREAARAAAQKAKAKRRRKVGYLTAHNITIVDYKDVNLLRRFLNEQGRILPARQTGNTAKQQRQVARAILRAREMALLPFVTVDINRLPWKQGEGET